MNVNELIIELQKLQHKGHGEIMVSAVPQYHSNTSPIIGVAVDQIVHTKTTEVVLLF